MSYGRPVPADHRVPPAPARVADRDVTGTTRRGALLASGALVGLAATGCGEIGPGVAPVRASAGDGDEAVLETVRTELAGAVALVAATRRAHRSLRRPLAALQAAHAAQLAVLDPDDETPDPPGAGVPGDPATALARLRDAEDRLGRRLLTWAVAVDSGPLARVLAAAAAGTAQHLAVLPVLADATGGDA